MAAGCRRGYGCPIVADAADPVPAILEYLPVPQGRRDRRRGREPTPLLRRTRLRERARGHARHRRLGRRLPRRVPRRRNRPTRSRCWRGSRRSRGARAPSGMIGYSWGGFNGAAGRGAQTAPAQGDRDALLDRRPLRRRLPLRGRMPSRRRHAQVGVVDARVQRAAARPRRRRATAGAKSGSSAWSRRRPISTTGSPTRRATSSGGRARSPRTTRRSRCRYSSSAAGPTRTPTPCRDCSST